MISTSLMTLGETINRSIIPEKLQFVNYATTWKDGKFSNYLISPISRIEIFISLVITSIFIGVFIGLIVYNMRYKKNKLL